MKLLVGYCFFFLGLLDGLLVCWCIAACFGEVEEEEEEEEEEKQKKNEAVNSIVLTCLMFKIITLKNVKYSYLCKIFVVILVV